MARVQCVQCGMENDPLAAAGYCEGCGKKLPPERSSSSVRVPGDEGYQAPDLRNRDRDERRPPRLSYHDDLDVSKGADEVAQAEQAARKNASGTLFAIAVLQLVCNSIVLLAAPGMLGGGPVGPAELAGAFVFVVAITAVFAGLGAWALYVPLPASVVGLICYVGLVLLDVAFAPEQIGKGIILKIVFIVALVQAIVAANKARQLRAARASERRRDEDEDRW